MHDDVRLPTGLNCADSGRTGHQDRRNSSWVRRASRILAVGKIDIKDQAGEYVARDLPKRGYARGKAHRTPGEN